MLLSMLAQAIDPSKVQWNPAPTTPASPSAPPGQLVGTSLAIVWLLLAITTLLYLLRRGNFLRWVAFVLAVFFGFMPVAAFEGRPAGVCLGILLFAAIVGLGFVVDHLTAKPAPAPGFPIGQPRITGQDDRPQAGSVGQPRPVQPLDSGHPGGAGEVGRPDRRR